MSKYLVSYGYMTTQGYSGAGRCFPSLQELNEESLIELENLLKQQMQFAKVFIKNVVKLEG